MATIMTLIAKIAADTAEFHQKMKDAEGSLQSMSDKTKKWGQGLTLGVTTPLVSMGVMATKAASDTEESLNKVRVVFGDAAGSMEDFASSAAQNLGLSRQEALETSGTFGNLFVAMGLGGDESADLSKKVLTLGADLASFNNLGTDEALEKIRSGLIGQSEPLRSLGVNMTEAGVKAKAMEMGLADADGELSEQAKIMARWAIIMEQTKTAQGDFARTSDGLANSTRILKGQISDAAAQLGQNFLPLALQLITWLKDAVAWFNGLSPAAQKTIIIIGIAAAALGPLLLIISAVTGALPALTAAVTFLGSATFASMLPVIGIVLLIVGILAVLYLAWTNNWGGIREKTAAAVDWISTNVRQFIDAITGWWNNGSNALRILWEGVWNIISTVFNTIVNDIKLVLKAFQHAFNGEWYEFGATLRKVWDNSWNMIVSILKTIWNTIKDVVSTAIKNVIEFFTQTDWAQVGRDIVQGIANGLKAAIGWITDAAGDVADAALDAMKGLLGIHSPSDVFAMEVGYPSGQGIGEGLEDSMDDVQARFPGMFSKFGALVPGFSGGGGGGGALQLNFTYAPAMSLGDADEAERIIAPIILSKIREERAKNGK